jgi:hypothetical protein
MADPKSIEVTSEMMMAGVAAFKKYISDDCMRVYADEDIVTSIFEAMLCAMPFAEAAPQANQSSSAPL